jgi:methionyl-tRNA synthetase
VIPTPGTLEAVDVELLRAAGAAFDTVGAHLQRSRFKQAAGEAMRVVTLANRYLSDTEPWKLAKSDVDRQATVLHTALQVVSDANTLLTPFLPHAAQQVHTVLGGTGTWAAQPEVREVTDDLTSPLTDLLTGVGLPARGRSYPIITGDYAAEQAHWGRTPIAAGTPLHKPTPLFPKLDPGLGETGPSWAPIVGPDA